MNGGTISRRSLSLLGCALALAIVPLSARPHGNVNPQPVDTKGIEGISGGLAPDLRSLEKGDPGDKDFIPPLRKGVVRDGDRPRPRRTPGAQDRVGGRLLGERRRRRPRTARTPRRPRLVVARNRNVIPQLPTLEVFGAEKIGVQFDTLEDNYLFNAFGGRLRDNIVHYPSTLAAATALGKNDVAAVMGLQSHIEAALAGKAERFGIAPVATPGLPLNGWDVGLAVKADADALAAALEKAMAGLSADGSLERIFTKQGITYAAPRPEKAP